MFCRSGAYSSYKVLLERRGLLKKCYDTENSREERALRKWCKENEIELVGYQPCGVDFLTSDRTPARNPQANYENYH